MNNLKSLKVRSLPVDDIKGQIIYVSVAEERKRKEVYYLKGDALICVDLAQGEESVLSRNINNVISAEFMSTQNKITVATSHSVIIIDCDSKYFYKREFDMEVKQVGWNITYDFLAIIFEDGIVNTYLFDMRFELISQGEGNVLALVPQREDVGWGSNSTQFQGPMRPDEIQPLEDHIAPVDDKKPVISWRGSGEEFVVSYFHEGVRQFKVFDNFCYAKANSESRKGLLYGPIAWKSQGNIIAAAMYQDQKNFIGLYERNGLFRMLFSLVDIYYPITFLSWSSCGRVLNVTQEDNKGQMHVCLYITSNTRWYLKQHLVFPVNNPLCTLTWTTTSPQCIELVAVTRNEVIQYKYKFDFDYDHRSNLVAAIDGKTIRIYGFKDTVDPPPSCTGVIVLDNPINMLAFHPTKDLAAVIDSANFIYCFAINGIELSIMNQTFLSKPVFPLNVNHLFWKGDNPHVLIENSPECWSSLYEFDMKRSLLVKKHQFDVTVFAIEHIYAIGDVMITYDGKFRAIHPAGENPTTFLNLPFPLKVIPLKHGNEICCLTLTPDQELYYEDELICKGITSMILERDFLLLTDDTTLYTMKLHRHSLEALPVDGLSEFHTRPLNEIAHLVCMMGNTPNIVLCTPRGNLEVISCRVMEVRIVEEMLSKGEWAEAIKLMRLTRMNWNLLIDLNPDRFYDNLPRIVSECNSQNILNNIVSEISDENCLTTVYNKTIEGIIFTHLNKRRDFLETLSTYLDQSGSFTDYLPTVLKICVDQNNIQKAMAYTLFLLNAQNPELREKAEKAVSLLRIHVDAEDLLKAALHTFDAKLADFIAQKCQMNPQEVDTILNDLRTKDNLDKRLAVHLRYQNWQEAITYMLRKENIDKNEILAFIQTHDVSKRAHAEALLLKLPFKDDIAKLYVEKLVSEGSHTEAAVISVQHGFYDEAVNQFKLALEYQKCVEYLPMSSFSEEDKRSLFIDLAEKLVAMQRISEAASIYEEHLLDYIMATKTLTHGRLFVDALRVARKYSLLDMIDVYILPKMIDSVQIIMDQIDESAKKFKTYLDRLKKLRNFKRYDLAVELRKRVVLNHKNNDDDSTIASSDSFGSRRLQALERERIADFDTTLTLGDSDVQSVISSGSRKSSKSNSSSPSTVTQKQVRKMEREKQDTTEGSRFEDIALIREMHILISSIFKLGPEVRDIFLRLIEYSAIDLNVLKLQHAKLVDIQQLMKDESTNIWHEDFKVISKSPHIAINFVFMDEKFRTIPPEMENPGMSWILETLK